MRNTVLFILIIAMALSTLAGCQKETNDSDVPVVTKEQGTLAPTEKATPQPTEEPTDTPVPEPEMYSPSDILGSADLNPFYEIKFPDDFFLETVQIHIGDWGIIGEGLQWHMYMLAPMEDESITKIFNIFGIDSQDTIDEYIETFHNEERIMFNGYEIEGSMGGLCEIYTTPKDNGWVVHILSIMENIDDEKYFKFIEDNYNMNIFGKPLECMQLLPIPHNFKIDMCYVDVNDMMQIGIDIIYPVEDIDTAIESVTNSGGYDWYNSDSEIFGIEYGIMRGNIEFDRENSQVKIYQQCKGISETQLCDYFYEPLMTMENYGMSYNADNMISIWEMHGEDYSSLVFLSSDNAPAEDWNFQFLYSSGQSRILLWFRPNENIYDIRIEKGKSFANYHYDVEKNIYEAIYPDKETIDEYLIEIYGSENIEDIYAQIFRILEQYTLDNMGISFEELIALPFSEECDYKPTTALPALPKSGESRTTLETLGLTFAEDEGKYNFYDQDNETAIDIFNEKWQHQTEEWNRDVIRYYHNINGYLLTVAYYPNKGQFEVQMYEGEEPSEDVVQSYFAYDINNDVVLDGITQGKEIKPEQFFADALGIEQTDAIFTDVFEIMEAYIFDTFNMTPEDLFALDAT